MADDAVLSATERKGPIFQEGRLSESLLTWILKSPDRKDDKVKFPL